MERIEWGSGHTYWGALWTGTTWCILGCCRRLLTRFLGRRRSLDRELSGDLANRNFEESLCGNHRASRRSRRSVRSDYAVPASVGRYKGGAIGSQA